MTTIRAYRFALDLTPSQERNVYAHAGAARVAHNWALARVKAVMGQRTAERSYGVPDEALTPPLSWSLAGLRKAWNAAKPDVAPWWGEVSKEAFNADAGFTEIRRQLAYKTDWNSGRLLVADRWYPSSKTCSGCGTVKTKLALSEREYTCETCGLVIDRDHNASLNLAALAAEFDTAGSGPVTARGANQKTRVRGQVAVKREPGTAFAGQTGTVPPQGRTIDRVLTKAH